MLAFTLTPLPDELLHSIVARHGTILGGQDAGRLSALFFGKPSNVVPADQPSRLDHAASMMGLTTGWELLSRHTQHHHDTAFATIARREASVAWALRGVARLRGRSGVMAMALPPRRVLSFCDRCIASRHGEDVHPWLRAHQLPGTFVCHLHENPLRATTVARTGRRGADGYTALTRAIIQSAPSQPRISERNGRVLLRYARGAAGLLEPKDWPDIRAIQDRLRAMLSDFRWERATSLIAMHKLVPALINNPNVAPLLEAMGVALPEEMWATALNGLLYRNRLGKHPLLVLMLLETIGAVPEDLLAGSTLAPTFAARGMKADVGPGGMLTAIELCANPSCSEMRLETVAAFASAATGRLGACGKCGFAIRAASRPGRRPILVRTCPSWDALVADALADPGTSVREVSRRFGVCTTTVMRAARRCGTWRPEWKDRPKLCERARNRPTALRNRHRTAWLTHATGAGSSMPIKRTGRSIFNAYRWLMRNDRQWIDANRHRTRLSTTHRRP